MLLWETSSLLSLTSLGLEETEKVVRLDWWWVEFTTRHSTLWSLRAGTKEKEETIWSETTWGERSSQTWTNKQADHSESDREFVHCTWSPLTLQRKVRCWLWL